MVVVIGTSGLLVERLLVVVIAAEYLLVLLAELGVSSSNSDTWLSRKAKWSSSSRTRLLRALFFFTIFLLATRRW
jgi:hypothetical protein